MVEFEIIEVVPNKQGDGFSVEIETKDRKRQRFGFPFGEGWENKEANGNERFINEIARVLEERENRKPEPNFKFENFKGKKIKVRTASEK